MRPFKVQIQMCGICLIQSFCYVLICGHFVLNETLPATSQMARALTLALRHSYSPYNKDVLVVEKAIDKKNKQFHRNLLDDVLPLVHGKDCYIIKTEIDEAMISKSEICLVFIFDGLPALEIARRMIHVPIATKSVRFLLVYTKYFEYGKDLEIELEKIAAHLNIKAHVLAHVNNFVYVYTSVHYKIKCDRITYKVHKVFNGSKFIKQPTNLFGSVINFHQCPLKVALQPIFPFVMITSGQSGRIKATGIEGDLLRVLAKKLNFSIKIVRANLSSRPKTPYKLILDAEADIAVGSIIYSMARDKELSTSINYGYYSIVALVPEGRSLLPLEQLRKGFHNDTWICLMGLISLGLVIILLIKASNREDIRNFVFGPLNRLPIFNLLRALLEGGIYGIPQRNFSRFIHILWILFSFIMRTGFLSSLLYILLDDTKISNIATIDDLVGNNFTFYCLQNLYDILRNHHVNIVKLSDFASINHLTDVERKKIAIIVFELNMQNVASTLSDNFHLTKLPQRLMYTSLCMYFQKYSYIKPIIDLEIRRLEEAGIIKQLELEYIFKFILEKNAITTYKTLNLPALSAIFVTFCYLLVFSCFVFVFELFSTRFDRMKRFLKLLN